MQNIRILGVALLSCLAGVVRAGVVASPDGRVVVEVMVNADGEPRYGVKRGDAVVIEQSRLGLVRAGADYSRGLSLAAEGEVVPVEDRYEIPGSKRRANTYRANRRVFELGATDGRRMDVVFQVSDDGVAFRYVFPKAETEAKAVIEETTSFRFAPEAKSWLQPMSVAKTGWSRTNPSYEEYYEMERPVGEPSTFGVGWVFPALFRTGDTWVLISEAGLGRGYCATRLAHEAPGGEYRIGFPDIRETMGTEPVGPEFAGPYATPWRVIALGDLKTVVESSLGTDLAEPAVATGALAGGPGKASWSWPKLGDGETKFDTQVRFVDYAAEMGWAYCLVDALWDKQIGDTRGEGGKLQELINYARGKGVKLLLWYNTNGDWNDAFQTPKNRMADGATRRAEFTRLRELGVAGVKIDFFGGDGRAFVSLYRDILDDAAAEGLLVNFHGATLPRGWERTYPNLMTVEAVRGYEFITFEQVNANRAPGHMAMMPFARNVFDAMDFTPVCLDGPGKIARLTTVGAELATAVLFTSGIQHYVEIPEVMAKQPDYVRTAMKLIPSVWEESRLLAGYPGKFAVMARRGSNGLWWVAGFNGEGAAKTVEVELGGIVGSDTQTAVVIGDAADGGFARAEATLGGERKVLRVELRPYGGFVTSVQ
jgi:hypothetical protein